MTKTLQEAGLFYICKNLSEFASIDHKVEVKLQELRVRGEITLDDDLIFGDHPEIDELIFENRDYLARLEAGFDKAQQFYHELERRLKAYKGKS